MHDKYLIDDALSADRCVISVMGAHAGESVEIIFKRKMDDINRLNLTFWLVKSPKAKPSLVQKLCTAGPSYAIFIEPSSKGGARPTEINQKATEYSEDGNVWQSLPYGLGPVTGKIATRAYALVFDKLETNPGAILDLWRYADYENSQMPIKLILGCSTISAVKKDMSIHSEKPHSRYRRIVAVARLAKPYSVLLK